MLYILNSAVLPLSLSQGEEANVRVKALTVEEARALLERGEFVSAVGHESTARVMSALLGVDIPYNRTQVVLKEGEKALQFLLGVRLPEGKVLTEEELLELLPQVRLNLVEVVSITSTRSEGA